MKVFIMISFSFYFTQLLLLVYKATFTLVGKTTTLTAVFFVFPAISCFPASVNVSVNLPDFPGNVAVIQKLRECLLN